MMGELRIGVLTCSDSRASGEYDDSVGLAIVAACEEREWMVVAYHVTARDIESITTSITEMADMDNADVIITLGGTGLTPRDVTPEATEAVCDRLVPGLSEIVRRAARGDENFFALSRAIAGAHDKTLVVNLPGGLGPAHAAFEALMGQLEAAVSQLRTQE
ncbi:MAG: molybdenum cofactor biosynthesis protein [Actinobacteria bacterium HGW-Actinobacteria-10]|nr:MAG: molybdenum cofactor biosynthesis protein [Actinobacteria bacterium HGW-Actinobacteria-10]